MTYSPLATEIPAVDDEPEVFECSYPDVKEAHPGFHFTGVALDKHVYGPTVPSRRTSPGPHAQRAKLAMKWMRSRKISRSERTRSRKTSKSERLSELAFSRRGSDCRRRPTGTSASHVHQGRHFRLHPGKWSTAKQRRRPLRPWMR